MGAKRFLLIAGGTVGGLGAVLSITPPQFGSASGGTLGKSLSGGTSTATAPAPAAAAADPAVKKSKNNICHDKTSPGYNQTKNFTPFATMDECVKSGGQPPKGNKK